MLRALNKLLAYLGIAPVLRLVANILLLFAAIALISDAAKTFRNDMQLVLTSGQQNFQELSPKAFVVFKGWIERTLPGFVWDPVLETLLLAPTWGLLGGLAALLLWLGRRRQPINVFVN